MKLTLLSLALLLPACGLTPGQWADISTQAAVRELPIIYDQVQSARTAAKNPISVNP